MFLIKKNKEKSERWGQPLFSSIVGAGSKPARIIFKNKRGSFLIEILLVVVILSVCLTLIVQSLLSNLRVMKYNKEYSQALLLLENQMSGMMMRGSVDGLEDQLEEWGERYQFEMEERGVESQGEESLVKEIKMGVLWHSGKADKEVSVVTYLLEDEDDE